MNRCSLVIIAVGISLFSPIGTVAQIHTPQPVKNNPSPMPSPTPPVGSSDIELAQNQPTTACPQSVSFSAGITLFKAESRFWPKVVTYQFFRSDLTRTLPVSESLASVLPPNAVQNASVVYITLRDNFHPSGSHVTDTLHVTSPALADVSASTNVSCGVSHAPVQRNSAPTNIPIPGASPSGSGPPSP